MKQSHSSNTSPFQLSADLKSLLYYHILTQCHSYLSQGTTYFMETFCDFLAVAQGIWHDSILKWTMTHRHPSPFIIH